MYEELRTAVLAAERQRRISLGLSPDPPKGMARFKNWLLNRQEQANGTDSGVNSDEIKKM